MSSENTLVRSASIYGPYRAHNALSDLEFEVAFNWGSFGGIAENEL